MYMSTEKGNVAEHGAVNFCRVRYRVCGYSTVVIAAVLVKCCVPSLMCRGTFCSVIRTEYSRGVCSSRPTFIMFFFLLLVLLFYSTKSSPCRSVYILVYVHQVSSTTLLVAAHGSGGNSILYRLVTNSSPDVVFLCLPQLSNYCVVPRILRIYFCLYFLLARLHVSYGWYMLRRGV